MLRTRKNGDLTPSYMAKGTPTFESTSNIATPASQDKSKLNSNRTVEKINYSKAALYRDEKPVNHHKASKMEYKPEVTTTYDDESLSACEWNPNLQSSSDVSEDNQQIKGIEMVTVCNEEQDFLNVAREEEEDGRQLEYMNPNTPAQLENGSTILEDSDFKLEHIRLSSSDVVPVSIIQDKVPYAVERRPGHAVGHSKDSASIIFNLVEYTEKSECTAKKTEVSTKHELPGVPNIRVEDGIVGWNSNAVLTSGFGKGTSESSTDATESDLEFNNNVNVQLVEI